MHKAHTTSLGAGNMGRGGGSCQYRSGRISGYLGTYTRDERIFSPIFKSVGFVNVDVEANNDGDITVRTKAKSRAE